jgi:hypothetical protein
MLSVDLAKTQVRRDMRMEEAQKLVPSIRRETLDCWKLGVPYLGNTGMCLKGEKHPHPVKNCVSTPFENK